MLRRGLLMPKRSFVIVVVALSGAFLAGCETSKNSDPLQDLTNAEIERLELEIKNLPEDSVVLKVLEGCIFAQK
jgi:outer membrane murein-binding lipoprotein Lpp